MARPRVSRSVRQTTKMRVLIEQVEQSVSQRLYYVALIAALAVPDIAGALDSTDGKATGVRYASWFDEWVRPVFGEDVMATVPAVIRARVPPPDNPLTGDACYQFRCSLLHQGSLQHPKSPYARIMFIEPGAISNVVHGRVLGDALTIDLPRFCREVVIGTQRWLAKVEGTANYEANYSRFAKRHANGLKPYIVGVPVIG
jgi:hypothetical protein